MANALVKDAPSKPKEVEVELLGHKYKVKEKSNEYNALTMEFNPDIKYMFNLAEESLPREFPIMEVVNRRTQPIPHQKWKPFQNIVYTSQIVWNNSRTVIRYYDGCDTLFVANQPKEKDVIDQMIKQTKKRAFLEGKFGCHGDERMLLLYLHICSWNADSPFRTRNSNQIFIPVDKMKIATAESTKLDLMEKAWGFAKEASETKMLIHANFLGIPMKDYDSGNDLTEAEIRVAYRMQASKDPAGFIESYGNKNIEIKYYIDKALKEGLINNKINANKSAWGSSNTEICDISGLKSLEAIGERLFEFSQSDEGAEFLIQLKSIFN